MTGYRVDSAQVVEASTAVQATAQSISADVDRMMRQLVQLQSCWQGQGATSFERVVAEWRATQEKVRAVLDDLQRALALAGRTYADAEAAAVRMFAG